MAPIDSVTECAQLVEREALIDQVRELVGAAADGHGRSLLLEATAGLGKTSLLDVARRVAREHGLLVLTARASEVERGVPFVVARQLLEPVVAAAPPARRRRLFAGAASLAAPLFAPSEGGTREALGVMHGLYWMLAELTEPDGCALVIDDLHWADEQSLRMLKFLIPRLEDLPLLLVMAARPWEPGGARADLEMAADSRTVVLHPQPLSAEGVAKLVERELENSDETLAASCHEATAGNPLFLTQLLRELPPGAGPHEVPRVGAMAVGAFITARLDRLDEAAAALAKAFAVLGVEADLQLACELAGVAATDATSAADGLARLGLLERGPGGWRFIHPVVLEAVRDQMRPFERADWHARAAAILHERHAEPASIAIHLLAAEPTDRAWAAGVLRDAAGEATARAAPGVAAGFLRRALREQTDAAERRALLRELGQAEACALAPAASDTLRRAVESQPDLRERAEVRLMLGRHLVVEQRISEAISELLAAAEEVDAAPELGGPERRELQCAIEAELCLAEEYAGDRNASRLDRRLGLARGESPLERQLLAALAYRGSFEGSTAEEVAALAHRAAGHASDPQPPWDFALPMVGHAFWTADRTELACRFARRGADHARSRGSVSGYALASSWHAHFCIWAGRLRDAESEAAAVLELTHRHDITIVHPIPEATLIEVLVADGRLSEAAELAASVTVPPGDELPGRWAVVLAARARLAAARRDTASALADWRRSGRILRWCRHDHPSFYAWRSPIALILAERGDADAALALVEEELAMARAHGSPRAIGAALRARALIHGGDALDQLAAAAEVLERSETPLELATTLVELGAALRRRGQRMAARDPLRRSLDLASQCGAGALAVRARDELAATGERLPRPLEASSDGLTPSERRVARLAAEGLSNREIAEALFVTLRTVESHLSSGYRKLGIRRRSQLADALRVRDS